MRTRLLLVALALCLHSASAAALDDTASIAAHLQSVYDALSERPTDGLEPQQEVARAEKLELLSEYIERGRFPQNRDFAERTPYFIDADGTACAVAYLMIESGAGETARQIASSQNNAYVADIQSDGLVQWLSESGLTAEEAAWIQPIYGGCGCEVAPVCAEDGLTYSNACYANYRGAVVVSEGCCEEDTGHDVETQCVVVSEAYIRCRSDSRTDGGCASAEPQTVGGLAVMAAAAFGLLALIQRRRSFVSDETRGTA
ncbi:MAG: MYXO-CTERM domain-containing protein [Bradymonadia bacterium]|jgi:MYXO-CTERM domain-containing protein